MLLSSLPSTAMDRSAPVSMFQLLYALPSLLYALHPHVMFSAAAYWLQTDIEDHANAWQIRAGCMSSDNIEHFGLSLNSLAAAMATTPNSTPWSGRDIHHVSDRNVLALLRPTKVAHDRRRLETPWSPVGYSLLN